MPDNAEFMEKLLNREPSDPMGTALDSIMELHKPSQVWHQRVNHQGTLISSTTTDGPCVICNPTITGLQHCDSCTNDGLEGCHPDTWCDGVRPSYIHDPWPCATWRLANEARGGEEHDPATSS